MLSQIDFLREISFASIFLRIIFAIIFGGIIGLERTEKNHPAGLRTHILVCVGSATVMMISRYIADYLKVDTDLSRLGAQVISGIGFLGAGTIITSGQKIKGLTTAAGLWATACLGLVIGVGFYELALIAGVSILFTLLLLSNISRKIQDASSYTEIMFMVPSLVKLAEILEKLRVQDVKVHNITTIASGKEGVFILTAEVAFPKKSNRNMIINQIEIIEGISVLGEFGQSSNIIDNE